MKVIINKDLIEKESLYYIQDTEGWYSCKYFTIREDYCYIKNDIEVKNADESIEDFNNESFSTLADIEFFLCNHDNSKCFGVSFKTRKNKKYAILEFFNAVYKIPYKYYKNLIDGVCTDVVAFNGFAMKTYSGFRILNNKEDCKIMLYNDTNLIGWLESCTFEIYIVNKYLSAIDNF